MIRGFIDGEDFHQKTVDMTGGIISRREAKIANFGKLYGMHPYGFAMSAKISVEAAYRYYEEYERAFPGTVQLREDVLDSVLMKDYIRMLGGRKRRNKPGELDDKYIGRVFLNSLIQGSAAIILKLAMISLFNEFRNRGAKMVLQVHDEILFEVPDGKEEKYAERIKEIMESCIELRVPIEANVEIGDHYGEMK